MLNESDIDCENQDASTECFDKLETSLDSTEDSGSDEEKELLNDQYVNKRSDDLSLMSMVSKNKNLLTFFKNAYKNNLQFKNDIMKTSRF